MSTSDDVLAVIPGEAKARLNRLFELVPPFQALTHLVVKTSVSQEASMLVRELIQDPAFSKPEVKSGLWLYVDELDASHDYSQSLKNATGSYWHGIMHRREGDFSNSHYWFRMVDSEGGHPVIENLKQHGYDPHTLIDDVKELSKGGKGDMVELIEFQRLEWFSLTKWCLENS